MAQMDGSSYYSDVKSDIDNDWSELGHDDGANDMGDNTTSTTALDPIVIVGMACRLPGGNSSVSKLWKFLSESRSAQGDIPASRFNIEGFYNPNKDAPGSIHTKGGYFLDEDIRDFENDFFGINNMEARHMDPSQRKLLEVVYECFENAGVPIESVSGANIACYVGNFLSDYPIVQDKDTELFSRFTATGKGVTILSNRISHAFNLRGPSMVVDTACSASIYGLHLACQSLKKGESDGAIVAGVNLIQSMEEHIATAKAGILSPTGTCRTFDASANGYGRADAVNALYLKRLSAALRDGDPIRAVIRGTAINSNGNTPGISLPSIEGQAAVIRDAYKDANLDPLETVYAECHGTGTAVGDPIEVEGLSRIFTPGRNPSQPLLIGSVKTNFGHSEAASGITSIIKNVLAMEKDLIPATVGVSILNPKIKTDAWNVEIVTKLRPWPQYVDVQRASINSFGYGGANAHAIIESAKSYFRNRTQVQGSSQQAEVSHRKTFLLPFSSNKIDAMNLQASLYSEAAPELNFHDLVHTLTSRRSRLTVRGFAIAQQDTLASDLEVANLRSSVQRQDPYDIAFVFTGQGAQWPQMGKELLDEFPMFRQSLKSMDRALQSLINPPSWRFEDAILEPAETSKIHVPSFSQPICAAVQIGLVQILSSWGLKPSGIVGHSSGEIAAAFAAGILTADQAIIAAYLRGLAVEGIKSNGSMLAISMTEDQARQEILDAGLKGQIVVGCVNSPNSITLSGDSSGIDAMFDRLQSTKQFARKLNTGGKAYHSHHMASISAEYESQLHAALGTVQLPHESIRFISSLTNTLVEEELGASYWRANAESAVLFAPAVETLLANHKYHLVEIGPHAALKMPIQQTASNMSLSPDSWRYSSALVRGKHAVKSLMTMVGELFLAGHDIDLERVNISAESTVQLKSLTDLPTYPWTYGERNFVESRANEEYRNRKFPRHELLGSQVPGGSGMDNTWRSVLRTKDVPWLEDHRLGQTIVFPAAGYCAMAVEALRQLHSETCRERPTWLRHVSIQTALILPSDPLGTGVEVFTRVQRQRISAVKESETWFQFEISSFRDGKATLHVIGYVTHDGDFPLPKEMPPANGDNLKATSVRGFYSQLEQEGLSFGENFQSLVEIKTERDPTASIAISSTRRVHEKSRFLGPNFSYPIHPITLDAMLQTSIMASVKGILANVKAKVPVMLGDLHIRPCLELEETDVFHVNASAKSTDFGFTTISADLLADNGSLVASFRDVRLTPFHGGSQQSKGFKRQPMLRISWKPDIAASFAPRLGGRAQVELRERSSTSALASVLSDLCHKNANLRILEVSFENDDSPRSRDVYTGLESSGATSSFKSYIRGVLQSNGNIIKQNSDKVVIGESDETSGEIIHQLFDLVVVNQVSHIHSDTTSALEAVTGLLDKNAMLLMTKPSKFALGSEFTVLFEQGSAVGDESTVLASLATSMSLRNVETDGILYLVKADIDDDTDAVVQNFSDTLQSLGIKAKILKLSDVNKKTCPSGSAVISFLEVYKPLLSRITESQMAAVQYLVSNSSKLLWLTGGAGIPSRQPEFSMVRGLARAVMLEQPALDFFTLDFDPRDLDIASTTGHLLYILNQTELPLPKDFEFILTDSLIHVSRLVPDEHLNESFRQRQGLESALQPLDQKSLYKLMITQQGRLDSAVFQEQIPVKEEPHAESVKVQVASVGLNSNDFSILHGKKTSVGGSASSQFTGVVTATGSGVSHLVPGDRVIALAPGLFQTTEQVPAWACQKLLEHEDLTVMSTLPVRFATALYALSDRANLKRGETVLIHCGTSGIGDAAIQIAQQIGAKVMTTVSSEAHADLIVKNYGLDREMIFSCRSGSFKDAVLAKTNRRGADVVLNTLTGDLLHESWQTCARFGRFIDIGRQENADDGYISMEPFAKSVSFTSICMHCLYLSDTESVEKITLSLMSRVLDLYRTGKIRVNPDFNRVFGIDETSDAFRYFGSQDRTGTVSLSYGGAQTIAKIAPLRYSTNLDSAKTYFLVGCLGGLGRSISEWMLERGARKFVFLGRSGLDKKPAQALVSQLRAGGAVVNVVRGDATNAKEVQDAIAAIDGSIGGVINAAMGLSESLFTDMSAAAWHAGVDPKCVGTWNIHNALRKREQGLDFFLLMSSLNGSMGAATESNYCAANAFLDAFAEYRRSRELVCTAVGLGAISEVGYVAENVAVQQHMQRRGIRSLTESELLQTIDIALSSTSSPTADLHGQVTHHKGFFAQSHILTGLEPFDPKTLEKLGIKQKNPVEGDPRASYLLRSFEVANEASGENVDSNISEELWSKPATVDTILPIAAKGLADLILHPLSQIDMGKPLSSYGMDSMLASEYRSWFFKIFKVDVPFMDILAAGSNVRSLSKLVSEGMLKKFSSGTRIV